MSFRITGLEPHPFVPLFGRPDAELANIGVTRMVADAPHAFPCRITLDDAASGETMLLLNYEHQPADTPFRSRHAIFVREGAYTRFDAVGTVPDQLRRRLLSVRAFDASHMMTDADVCDGTELEPLIERLLADPTTVYLHIHFAGRGCYAAQVSRTC